MEEVVGSLKAYEEQVKGVTETSQGQLLLTEEGWRKEESNEGKLLLTREEWLKKIGRDRNRGNSEGHVKMIGDMSKVRCFNCQAYGHFTAECQKTS